MICAQVAWQHFHLDFLFGQWPMVTCWFHCWNIFFVNIIFDFSLFRHFRWPNEPNVMHRVQIYVLWSSVRVVGEARNKINNKVISIKIQVVWFPDNNQHHFLFNGLFVCDRFSKPNTQNWIFHQKVFIRVFFLPFFVNQQKFELDFIRNLKCWHRKKTV